MSDKLDIQNEANKPATLTKGNDVKNHSKNGGDLGKVSKIVGTAKSVTEELAHIVDLKVKLVQTEAEERINEKVNAAIQKSIGMLLFGLIAFMALIGVALVVGNFLGSSGFGFFAVAGILLIMTLVLRVLKPRWFNYQMNRVDIVKLIGTGMNEEGSTNGND